MNSKVPLFWLKLEIILLFTFSGGILDVFLLFEINLASVIIFGSSFDLTVRRFLFSSVGLE